METHARIFNSEKLNKQILVYRNYDNDEDVNQLVVRFLIAGANVEIKIGYSSFEKAKEFLKKVTLESLEKLIEHSLPANVLNEEEE